MRLARAALAAFPVIAFAACGGSDLTLPSEGEPAQLSIAGGDGQNARVGEALAQPLVVVVTDSKSRPVVGTKVAFVLSGDDHGATLAPDTAATDNEGKASSRLTLGTQVGAVAVTARVAGASSAALTKDFGAMALAEAANLIAAASGGNQSAPAGTALADPLVVRVTDSFGNPIPGVAVTWAAQGGGSVDATSSTTGSDGTTQVMRTLGPTAGTQTATATAAGLAGSPVTFTHQALAGNANRVQIVSGNNQSAQVGTALAAPLVVSVTDASGNPIAGRAVSWVIATGGGGANPPSSTTGADGHASTQWTVGASPGSNTLNAVVSGVGVVTFNTTATPSPGQTPKALQKNGGDNQTASVGTTLPQPHSVKVLSATNAPVAGVTVAWAAASGGGSVSASTSVTDGNGVAQIFRTLGSTPGPQTTTASVTGLTGSPATFTATATPGASPRLAMATQPSAQAFSGQPFGTQPVVQLQTPAGAPLALAGVDVTAAIASGGGALGGTTTRTTGAAGRAAFTDLQITGGAGSRTLIFAANGYTSANSSAIDVRPPGPSQPNSSIGANPATITTAQTSTVTATVHDAFGAPLAGAAVTWSTAGGSVEPPSGVTNAQGQAATTFTPNTTGGVAVNASVSASGATIALSTTVTVNAAPPPPPPPPPANIAENGGNGQTAPAGTAVPIPPSVRVTDAGGAPVAGVAVTFTPGPEGSTVTGGSQTTDANGVATVGSWTLGATAGDYTLVAATAAVPSQSVTFTATATSSGGGAGGIQLNFRIQPSDGPAGQDLKPAVVVAIRDGLGNVVDSAKAVVMLTLSGGTAGAKLEHDRQSAKRGVATFDDLRVDRAGTGYRLIASAAGLQSATSDSFNVSP